MAISRRNKTKNIAKTLRLRPCRPSHYTLRRWELPWSVRAAPAAARVSQPFHSDLHSIGTQDDLKAIGRKDFAKELTAIAVFLVKQHSKSCNDPLESLKSILSIIYTVYTLKVVLPKQSPKQMASTHLLHIWQGIGSAKNMKNLKNFNFVWPFSWAQMTESWFSKSIWFQTLDYHDVFSWNKISSFYSSSSTCFAEVVKGISSVLPPLHGTSSARWKSLNKKNEPQTHAMADHQLQLPLRLFHECEI